MTARCTGEAVSWLRLERYHLGELAEHERRTIDAHLAGCPACASCLARIVEDDAVLLPALPLAAAAAGKALNAATGARATTSVAARAVHGRWLVRATAAAGV
ncbi:MAG TPA: zf-HC2 domain-containing protein, partial [Polyangiaceae bacterium]